MASAIMQLNIYSHETEYYWLGRGWLALELPEFWDSKIVDAEKGEVFIYTPQ